MVEGCQLPHLGTGGGDLSVEGLGGGVWVRGAGGGGSGGSVLESWEGGGRLGGDRGGDERHMLPSDGAVTLQPHSLLINCETCMVVDQVRGVHMVVWLGCVCVGWAGELPCAAEAGACHAAGHAVSIHSVDLHIAWACAKVPGSAEGWVVLLVVLL